jgi:uncharacterized protein (TIGR02466 family)
MPIVSYESGQLFPTHVWSFKSDHNFDEALRKCLEMEGSEEGRVRSNKGGFQSNTFSAGDVPELIAVEKFAEDAMRHTEAIAAQQYNCPLRLRVQEKGLWLNVNRQGHFNVAHTHPRAAFAFVCYLQVDDPESKLAFLRPDLSIHYPFDSFDSAFYQKDSYCQVSSGLGVLFPAWLSHAVCVNNSPVPRVSVAINIEQY